MFDFGPTEIILIIVALLLLFGGKKLPELAQGIGKGIKEFKKAVKEPEQEEADSKAKKEDKVD